jgi:hypothetical protein
MLLKRRYKLKLFSSNRSSCTRANYRCSARSGPAGLRRIAPQVGKKQERVSSPAASSKPAACGFFCAYTGRIRTAWFNYSDAPRETSYHCQKYINSLWQHGSVFCNQSLWRNTRLLIPFGMIREPASNDVEHHLAALRQGIEMLRCQQKHLHSNAWVNAFGLQVLELFIGIPDVLFYLSNPGIQSLCKSIIRLVEHDAPQNISFGQPKLILVHQRNLAQPIFGIC